MNAEARERESKYVMLQIGQKRPYLFDPKILDPEPRKRDDGTDYTVHPYVVEDERFPGYGSSNLREGEKIVPLVEQCQ